jgi:5'-deoxynucleotidase YfbR-like HD superfamily hydrolase
MTENDRKMSAPPAVPRHGETHAPREIGQSRAPRDDVELRAPRDDVELRAPRAWQRMLSGRRLDLLNPDPADIEIEDIAHGLARVARWNGQTSGAHAFSVAQHVLLVEEIASDLNRDWHETLRLAALLHDAAEYVIGDLISPFKTAIGLDYKAFELRLLEAIHVRFGLPARLPDEVTGEIKRADRIAAFYEATRLAGFSVDEAEQFFGRPEETNFTLTQRLVSLQALPAADAQRLFLERFAVLARSS